METLGGCRPPPASHNKSPNIRLLGVRSFLRGVYALLKVIAGGVVMVLDYDRAHQRKRSLATTGTTQEHKRAPPAPAKQPAATPDTDDDASPASSAASQPATPPSTAPTQPIASAASSAPPASEDQHRHPSQNPLRRPRLENPRPQNLPRPKRHSRPQPQLNLLNRHRKLHPRPRHARPPNILLRPSKRPMGLVGFGV